MKVERDIIWEKMYDKRARYTLLCGKREHVVKKYVALSAEYERTRRELMTVINFMRQTCIALDFLLQKGG